MDLLMIAHVPPILVSPESTVMQAVELSLPARVGAVAVMEDQAIRGIFTERDLMFKVVHQKLDPDRTLVREVMTAPVRTIRSDMPVDEVLRLMLQKHIRHLPISPDGREVEGMLSIRNVLQHMVMDLKNDLQHMENYLGADSPGG